MKITLQITFDIVHIIILESPVCAEMIEYHNGHNFTFRHLNFAVTKASASDIKRWQNSFFKVLHYNFC